MSDAQKLEKEIQRLLPQIQDGMRIEAAYQIIIDEIERLKEIEHQYNSLCK